MKKLFLLGFAITVFIACQNKPERYFADSAEIEILKSGVNAYETGDWSKWKSHFADTAKIYVNSSEAITADERLEGLKASTSAMSSYGFDHEKEYIEMVLDKEDETWVYYWALHKGTFAATNNEVSVPVHLAVQFLNGKIVEEHVYFDATAMNAEFETLANLEAETDAETTEE